MPAAAKQERLLRLNAVLDAQYRRHSDAMVGSRQRVLATGRAVKDAAELQARTANNRVVNFAGDAGLIGRYVDVTITTALPHSLRAASSPPPERLSPGGAPNRHRVPLS